jgi:hypothetical protein
VSELRNREIFWVSSLIFAVFAAWLQHDQHGMSRHWAVAVIGGIALIVSITTGVIGLVAEKREKSKTDTAAPTPSSPQWRRPDDNESSGD